MILRHLSSSCLLLLALACTKTAGHGTGVGRAECDTIDYEARNLSARVELAGRASIDVDTSKQAIRQVDTWVEKYFAAWSTACNDYKNGALTREEYRDESSRIRQAMERFEELALRLQSSQSDDEFATNLRDTWTSLAPAGEGVDLSAALKVMVKRPGASDFVVAPPGVTLPTGTQLYTLLRLEGPANVQFYQVDVRGKTNVIFPDPQIDLKNPLPGGQEIRLPNNGVFELDDKDLGIEDLHVVVSADAVEAPAPAAESRVIEADCKQRGLKFVPDACPKTRGLVFKGDASSRKIEAGGASIAASNAAAQRGIHMVYTFHHVGDAAAYGDKCTAKPGEPCRGVEPLRSTTSKRPPKMPDNFAACPGKAAPKEMAGPSGSYERWCVEHDAGGQLVDHGPYRKWYAGGSLWVKGELDLGRRKGTWTTYDAAGGVVATVDY
jgi:hypothetical protein